MTTNLESTIFALRLAPEEWEEIVRAAKRQERTISDLVRTGALAKARKANGAED